MGLFSGIEAKLGIAQRREASAAIQTAAAIVDRRKVAFDDVITLGESAIGDTVRFLTEALEDSAVLELLHQRRANGSLDITKMQRQAGKMMLVLEEGGSLYDIVPPFGYTGEPVEVRYVHTKPDTGVFSFREHNERVPNGMGREYVFRPNLARSFFYNREQDMYYLGGQEIPGGFIECLGKFVGDEELVQAVIRDICHENVLKLYETHLRRASEPPYVN